MSEDIIRQIFNENKIYEKTINGNLTTHIKRDSHLSNPQKVGHPYCTWSQIVYYYDKDKKPVAIVHQYLKPDGTIGASGVPDPKRIFIDGKIFSVRSKPKE